MSITRMFLAFAIFLAAMIPNGARAQAATCTLGGSCRSVVPTCVWDSVENPLPATPTQLNVGVVPAVPNALTAVSGVFRFNGTTHIPWDAYPMAAVEQVGNSLRITYRGGYEGFLARPNSLCSYDLGTLAAGNYHLEYWLAVFNGPLSKMSEVDFSVTDAISLPTLSPFNFVLLVLVLMAALGMRSLVRQTR